MIHWCWVRAPPEAYSGPGPLPRQLTWTPPGPAGVEAGAAAGAGAETAGVLDPGTCGVPPLCRPGRTCLHSPLALSSSAPPLEA